MLSQGTGNIAKGQTDVERGAGLTWVARMSRFMTAVAESQSDIVGFLHNVAGSLIIQDMAHILITENRFLDEYTSQLRLGCVEKIDPGAVRAKAYDIVLNGTEMGGGSVRIHQADVQSKMLEVLGFTAERANEQFGFLLDAFKYGVPPHAGLAYGFDRMVMLMVGADSIRDVIAFPKVKDASCLMMEAPAAVDEKQLEELSIAVAVAAEKE